MDFYQFCEHCGRRVSEKTYKEHRRLYFHDGKWLFVKHAEVKEISDSTPLSISLPPESIGGDSSDFSNAVSIMDDAFDDGTSVSVCMVIHTAHMHTIVFGCSIHHTFSGSCDPNLFELLILHNNALRSIVGYLIVIVLAVITILTDRESLYFFSCKST